MIDFKVQTECCGILKHILFVPTGTSNEIVGRKQVTLLGVTVFVLCGKYGLACYYISTKGTLQDEWSNFEKKRGGFGGSVTYAIRTT
jgi:hypothetical protein